MICDLLVQLLLNCFIFGMGLALIPFGMMGLDGDLDLADSAFGRWLVDTRHTHKKLALN